MTKTELEREYSVAKKMGGGAGFWSIHCQKLIRFGIAK